jgi:hypothetical protein
MLDSNGLVLERGVDLPAIIEPKVQNWRRFRKMQPHDFPTELDRAQIKIRNPEFRNLAAACDRISATGSRA